MPALYFCKVRGKRLLERRMAVLLLNGNFLQKMLDFYIATLSSCCQPSSTSLTKSQISSRLQESYVLLQG